MAGAGTCRRIFEQMEHYPIDIIGNYGMQYAEYSPELGDIKIIYENAMPCDRESVLKRANALREKYRCTDYKGESVEFHASGCVTLPVLGTAADIADKLSFDPDRAKRRAVYADIKATFPDYTVFVGGSSSFDMAPAPYDKYKALCDYCAKHGFTHDNVVYVGDDYGTGGNDEAVYISDIPFIRVDSYTETDEKLRAVR